MKFEALKKVDLKIEKGELTAIVGPSGSGKSTILNMITGIDRPTNGMVRINGQRIDNMKENKLAKWRGKNIGIIFQFFQLFSTLTALENAMLPMDFAVRGTQRERITKNPPSTCLRREMHTPPGTKPGVLFEDPRNHNFRNR